MNGTMVRLGPDVSPGELVIAAASGTATIPDVEFFDEDGRARPHWWPTEGAVEHLGTLAVDTTGTKLKDAWRSSRTPVPNETEWNVQTAGRPKIVGARSGPVSGAAVLVYESSALTATPLARFEVGERLTVGQVPGWARNGSGGAQVNVSGMVDVGVDGGYVYFRGERYEVKRASLSAPSSGNNTVVAAVTGKRLAVVSAFLVATAAVSAQFRSGATTALTGAMALAANGGLVLGGPGVPWLVTASGEALTLNLSGAVAVNGAVVYAEVV